MTVQEIFEIKLNYLIQLTRNYKSFRIPLSWWEYAAPTNKDVKVGKNGMHEYGTSFTLVRLDKEFNDIYTKKLKEANIKFSKLSNGILYEYLP